MLDAPASAAIRSLPEMRVECAAGEESMGNGACEPVHHALEYMHLLVQRVSVQNNVCDCVNVLSGKSRGMQSCLCGCVSRVWHPLLQVLVRVIVSCSARVPDNILKL